MQEQKTEKALVRQIAVGFKFNLSLSTFQINRPFSVSATFLSVIYINNFNFVIFYDKSWQSLGRTKRKATGEAAVVGQARNQSAFAAFINFMGTMIPKLFPRFWMHHIPGFVPVWQSFFQAACLTARDDAWMMNVVLDFVFHREKLTESGVCEGPLF